MNHIFVRLFLPLLLLVLAWSTLAMSAETADLLALSAEDTHIEIDAHVRYFSETAPVNPYKLLHAENENRWRVPDKPFLHFGNSPEPIWMRLDLRNDSHLQDWLLEIAWTYIEHATLITYDHENDSWGSLLKAGTTETVIDTKNPYHVLPLTLEPGHHTTVLLRLESSSKLLAPFHIWSKDAYQEQQTENSLLYGLFFGAILIMFCYNFSLFIFTRDSSYFFYAAYILAIILHTSTLTGHLHQNFLRNDWLRDNVYGIFSSLSFLMAMLFLRNFLSLRARGGWLLRMNDLILCHWTALLFCYLFFRTTVIILAEDIGAVLTCLGGLMTTIILWRNGNSSARYYTFAWCVRLLGTTPFMLSMVGLVGYSQQSLHLHLFGFIIEVLLLSLALGNRQKHERSEWEDAQKMALDLTRQLAQAQEGELKAQAKMLTIQHRTTEDLERRVLERTLELEQTLKSLEQANNQLAELSITDALTGISNRRYFDQIIEHEFRRAIRAKQPLSVVLADIDHFKSVNDTHGHQAGDQCLRAVAKALQQQCIRGTDLVARYGGEEFAIVLPATAQLDAAQIADKARQAIEQIDVQWNGRHISLCASFGVAGWLPYPGETMEAMLQAADKALYRAKSRGRNQVATAPVEHRQILPLLPLRTQ